ncbi:NAD-dependent epimerase/dehydratase family protein [Candidatus Leptofilum sp.]|uniref:NAD-dependent epimerase/dehydratase family protein n=1 Tax=Candidatus Leptofilum sp. TaxID=3241576 RepID=UPI003B599256
MSQQIKHVILGTGQLGLAIMDELVAAGQPVTLVNRSGGVNEPLPADVSLETADCNNPDDVARVTEGAEVIFFCVQPAYHQWPEQFPPLAASIIEGVSRNEARLLFGDNLYMYGATAGQPIHEDLPYAAETRKGQARAKVANMLLDAHKASKVAVTIGRASDFYGPRVTDSMAGEMLFAAAMQGKTVNLVGNLDLPHTLTYIRDFARALVTLSENEAAYGRAWHVPSAKTLTQNQFIKLVEAEIGRPIKVRTAGKLIMRLLGIFNPAAGEVVEMMYEFEEPFVVDHSQFAAAFGTQITPHKQAIQETVAWYRQQE